MRQQAALGPQGARGALRCCSASSARPRAQRQRRVLARAGSSERASSIASGVLAAAVSLSSLLGPPAAVDGQQLAAGAAQAAAQPGATVRYEQQLARSHRPPSNLPSSDEAAALALLNRDLFTQEAWTGMVK